MIKVLVVDDSEVVRRIVAKEISRATDMQVVGTAADPYEARDKILALQPDVVTLDLEMPRMDGLTFLARLMRYHPLPVIVVSSLVGKGSEMAVRALECGAVDVLAKPAPPQTLGGLGAALVAKIRAASLARCSGGPSRAAAVAAMQARAAAVSAAPVCPLPHGTAATAVAPCAALAIGASTGGTQALQQLLAGLPADSPCALIVQHMPEAFTAQFARRLDDCSALEVHEAHSGDAVTPGRALLAPGNRHMVLVRKGNRYAVEIKDGPLVHQQRPSIDVLFHSVAASAGAAAAGVLLTGMGNDGARGLLAMRQAGARTFAQDEQSCAVFGMPKEAIRIGGAEEVVSLARMSQAVRAAISRQGCTAAVKDALPPRELNETTMTREATCGS